jgi:thiamine pyrophosphokinase
MQNKTALIIGGGEIPRKRRLERILQGECVIVAANGGILNCAALGLKPGLAVGDMDSVPPGVAQKLEAEGVKLIRHPARKDQSDMELALETALSLGPERVFITGALGRRSDHSLFNVHLLFRVPRPGVPITIIGRHEEMFAARSPVLIHEMPGTVISLVPMSPVVQGVDLEGFEYPLKGEDLHRGTSRGLSNVLARPPGVIRFRAGDLLVIINGEDCK